MNESAVAVIGLACRFPKAPDARAYWKLLASKKDAITEVPADRWDIDAYYDPRPATPGKMYVRSGGFLENLDQFDPQFYGIAPREAESMDPQQRLVLEVAYESIQDAGIALSKLKRSVTGVFVGVQFFDYFQVLAAAGADFDTYTSTGNAHSIVANRLSYLLDLRGPSMSLDTACSSGLVAVHNACQSLRSGESNVAIAGAVNLLLSPDVTIALSQARILSPDGRCKAFDARADGYVRSEGCGMVVLKRLSDALKDGDPIWAVLRGTSVNHGGRSNGLTAPNSPAQEAVITRALQMAELEPHHIGYVEAHGTGTALGDPIELEGINSVLGRGRKRPLIVGSAKTNVGHLEAASGLAGLIKVILSLHEGAIPGNVHLNELNPKLELAKKAIEIPTQLIPWSRTQTARLAGVSSFGFGGTNAHAIVEEAPEVRRRSTVRDRTTHVFALSGRTPELMLEEAAALAERIAVEPELEAADLCYTRNVGRDEQPFRFGIVTRSLEELETQLAEFAASDPSLLQRRPRKAPKLAFLFAGQGSQAHNMGRALFETEPVFREAMERCAAIADRELATPLFSLLYGREPDPNLNQTSNAQIALFAVEYALAAWWRSVGVVPDIVLGHSLGEIVAAVYAGVLELEDAIRLVLVRGRLMQECGGKMASVFAAPAEVENALEGDREVVNIAAVNEPEHTVISGSAEGVARVTERLERAGRVVRALKVSGAFHSPEMDPVLDRFREAIAGIRMNAPKMAWVSNLTGEVQAAPPDAAYWVRHVRHPVRFASGIKAAADLQAAIFLEMGSSNTLSQLGKRCLPGAKVSWLPSLSPSDEHRAIAQAAAQLWAAGIELDWERFDAAHARSKLRLPPLPYQRERYWFTPGEARGPQTFRSIAQKIHERALKTPEAIAFASGGERLSYREMMRRAKDLEAKIRATGKPAGSKIVVFGEPAAATLTGIVAVLGAGCVAVPLGPSDLPKRIANILDAVEPSLLLTENKNKRRFSVGPNDSIISLDDPVNDVAFGEDGKGAAPTDAALLLYPRDGTEVMNAVSISEAEIAAFARTSPEEAGAKRTWLALGDPARQPSVMELLNALARGDQIVFLEKSDAPTEHDRGVEFSLLYFAQEERDNDHYRLLLDGARFADEHGFAAVWTQEQHFHEIGGAYPNPSITAAAVAAITRRVGVRGSLLLPLHHPVRVVEEWAMIDRLSRGRVGLSVDSGIYPNDFVFDSNFETRRETLRTSLDLIRRCWSGEAIETKNGEGAEVKIEVHPRPVQAKLPHWLSAGCEDPRYLMAAELGAAIIIPLAAMRFDELQRRIALYREKWREHGHAGEGYVTVMMHVFVGDDVEEVREIVRGPMNRQLKLSARRLSALEKRINDVDEESLDQFAKIAFEQHFEKGGLFGTVESVLPKVEAFKKIGVDEIACLVDYGVPAEIMTASFSRLDRLRRAANPKSAKLAREEELRAVTHVSGTAAALEEAIAEASLLAELREKLSANVPAPSARTPAAGTSAAPAAQTAAKKRPGPKAAAPSAEYAAPTTETERVLAEIWSAVLHLPRVGIHDNFFDLGGDSRLGIEIVSRARSVGLTVETLHIFERPTIAELAAVVRQEQHAAP